MQRVLAIGVALGLAAALVSKFNGDDEFCALAKDDGLVAGKLGTPDQRQQYRDRLDDADASAPGSLADELDTLRDAASPPEERSAGVRRDVPEAHANIDEWVVQNCA